MLRPNRRDEDFAAEIGAHLQHEADRLIAEGMSPDEARFAAARRFGNVARVRERFYYSQRSTFLDLLKQDLRTALRGIRRYPIACVIAVISLAGGIGATTVTLVLRNAIFLAPPPLYAEPDELYAVRSPTPQSPRRLIPAGLMKTWLRDAELGGNVAAAMPPRQRDVKIGEQLGNAAVRAVTPNLFKVLGVPPALGTSLHESPADAEPPAVLSGAAWLRLFDARDDVVGMSILIDGIPHRVIGVMPRRFWFSAMDGPIWTRAELSAVTDDTPVTVVVRRPSTMSEAALAEWLNVSAAEYAASLPAGDREFRVTARNVRGTPIGDNIGPTVVILLTTAVVLTLLIACTNVAVLMMAQWTAREHEIAIRASLGGARWRIIRSLLTESILIATVGGILGVALTVALRGLAVRRVPTAALFELSIDPLILIAVALLTFAVGLLTGIAPALYETSRLQVNPLTTIRGSDRVRQRWRHVLVVFEIAATVALLVSAGAMLSSYARSFTESPGFDPHPMLSANVEMSPSLTPRMILERLRSIPGVAAAEVATAVPYLAMGSNVQVSTTGSDRSGLTARTGAIGPDYFSTLGVAVRAGRPFTDADAAGSARVAIVNEVLATMLVPGGDVSQIVGELVVVDGRSYHVVGVVADYSLTAIQPPRPQVFTSFAQLQPAPTRAQFMIRATADAATLTQTVRSEISEMPGGATVAGVVTFNQIIDIIGQEIIVGTFPLFPLIATGLLLTAAGIYGVLAFAVSRRATELALRVAVGASRRDLLRLVAGHSLKLLAVGTAIGIGATYALTRVAQGRGGVFDTPGWHTFAVPLILIVSVALIATIIPLRRALAINPATLLRTS